MALGSGARPLRLPDILALHRVLMLATTTPEIAGALRDRQNWIGGNATTLAGPTSCRRHPRW